MTRVVDVVLESVPLPVTATSSPGYGSALRSVGGAGVVTSWLEGTSAVRLALVDTTSGSAAVVKGARGLLRDAVIDPDGDRAWLLGTHALHEVDLDPFRITRTVSKGIGTFNSVLTRLPSGLLVIGKPFGRSAVLVSTETMTAVGRTAVPTWELAISQAADATLLLAPASGTAVVVDGAGKRIGKARPVPVGTTPVVTRTGGVAYLAGATRPAVPEHPGVDAERYAHVVPSGVVTLLDPSTLTTVAAGTFPDIGSLGVCADDGRLLASSTVRGVEVGSGLALLDPDALTASWRGRADAPVVDMVDLGGHRVAVNHTGGAGHVVTSLTVLSWEM